ncbi:MAG TPA: ferrous iron transport protein B [bacterium]
MSILSCHDPSASTHNTTHPTIALVGNPNVGKSTVFNGLTGLRALTTNYPGTTVEVAVGTAALGGRTIQIIDLPGTYGLTSVDGDQRTTWETILKERPDAVLAVVDGTNLARNLYLVLQLIDLGFPVVVALNMSDELEREGLRIDAAHLGTLLGIPVVATVATKAEGLREVLHLAATASRASSRIHRYSPEAERAIAAIAVESSVPDAFLTLEGAPPPGGISPETNPVVRAAVTRFEEASGCRGAIAIAVDRHAAADRITNAVRIGPAELRGRMVWRVATNPATGVPILAGVLGIIFAGLFWGGSMLAGLTDRMWAAVFSPVVRAVVTAAAGSGMIGRTVLWAADAGINALLSIGIPYVLTFYLLLAILEDTGYLTAAAVLLDRSLGRFGLTGRAAIPLVAGAGCNVPAIIGLRTLRTERERLIAGTLITLVPCSARTAVIFGAVAALAGPGWAIGLYVIVALVISGAGWGLNRLLPGGRPILLMEVFPFRAPTARTVLRKTWFRVREFVVHAAPVVLAGSLLLGALYETGLIRLVARPLSPIVEGWLGLPAVAGLTLVFAVLRKELALQLLLALALVEYGRGATSLLAFMTPQQIFTYALVNTIYIPCAATIAILGKTLGWRRAGLISAGTITLAVLVGGVATRVLGLLLPYAR